MYLDFLDVCLKHFLFKEQIGEMLPQIPVGLHVK